MMKGHAAAGIALLSVLLVLSFFAVHAEKDIATKDEANATMNNVTNATGNATEVSNNATQNDTLSANETRPFANATNPFANTKGRRGGKKK